MGKKTIREARVKDLEKRRYPTKHYVYVLEVSWSEGSSTVIYRRYSDFFEFQCELLEKFPEESGAKDPANRMIPFLPGKKLLGRSHTRAVAERRKEKIDEYCQALIRLPQKISDDQFVIDFFEIRPDDINTPNKPQKSSKAKISDISEPIVLDRYVAIADYEKQKKNECSLTAGQTVEVVDKNQNGWWFVNLDDFHEGWVPATYLEPLYGSEDISVQRLDPGEEELHITANQYTPQNDDELGFEKGVIVEVFEKGLDGWWKIRYQGKEGLAPAAYLQRYHGQASEAVLGAQVVSSVKEAVSSTISGTALPAASLTPKQQPAMGASPTTVSSPTVVATTPPTTVAAIAAATATLSSSSTESSKPKFQPTWQPTWHSQAKPYIDKEPIYAPTPRRHSIKKKALKKRLPPPVAEKKPGTSSPTTSPTPSSPVLTSPNMAYDHPEPVYEIIPDPVEEIYVTVADFTAAHAGDGLSFKTGYTCSVVTKNANGWWYVDMDGSEGWVPSSYLERRSTPISPVHISNSVTSSLSPPPPLPTRSKSIGNDKSKPVAVAPVKTKSPISPRPYTDKFEKKPVATPLKKDTSSSTSTSALTTEQKRSSLKRSASSDAIDKEKPVKSVLPRIHSPPIQPVTRKPIKERPRRPSGSQGVEDVKKSPRSLRKCLDSKTQTISQPKPAPRKATMSKTFSLEDHAPKPVPRSGGHQKSSSTEMLLLPNNNNTRSVPFGSKPPRRNSGDSSSSAKHKEELGRILQQKTATVAPSATKTTKRVPPSQDKAKLTPTLSAPGNRPYSSAKTPISRPVPTPKSPKIIHISHPKQATRSSTTLSSSKPSTTSSSSRPYLHSRPAVATLGPKIAAGSVNVKTVKKGPPKRPEPPKLSAAGKKQPPPRPVLSPATKRKVSYTTISDYSGSTDGCISFADGASVEVLEKNDDGWWFVKIGPREGWAPSTFIEEKEPAKPARPKPPTPTVALVSSKNPTETTVQPTAVTASGPVPKPRPRPRTTTTSQSNFVRAVSDYDVPIYDDSGIPVMRGRLYEIKEKSNTGWWFLKDGDNEGWVPASYFKPA